jgi:hypothetical protein
VKPEREPSKRGAGILTMFEPLRKLQILDWSTLVASARQLPCWRAPFEATCRRSRNIARLAWGLSSTKKCGTSFQTCRIAQSLSLLQLALSLFCKIKVFLDHLGRVLRKFLHVGIGSRIGLFLKSGQILFVIFHHHIHVRFI